MHFSLALAASDAVWDKLSTWRQPTERVRSSCVCVCVGVCRARACVGHCNLLLFSL